MRVGVLTHLPRHLQNALKTPFRQQTLGFRAAVAAAKFSSQVHDSEDFKFGNYDIILPPHPIIWGTSHIVPRSVPEHIPRPSYAVLQPGTKARLSENFEESYEGDGRIRIGSHEELKLRKAAQLAKRVREYAGSLVKVGVTTNSIDASVHEYIISHRAYPSPLLYSGFPRSCCTSVNNVISHGIPDDRPLQDGDIVNIDITIYLDGYHGDTSQIFLVGEVDDQGKDLVEVANEALRAGIQACGPERSFKGIGKAIHEVTRPRGFSVSSQFSGHGIGSVFHRPPWILHDLNDEPGVMLAGHCFTIEPCIIQGLDPQGWIFPDGWTASTENCARSAQAEHMVLITETGVDVLTQ